MLLKIRNAQYSICLLRPTDVFRQDWPDDCIICMTCIFAIEIIIFCKEGRIVIKVLRQTKDYSARDSS